MTHLWEVEHPYYCNEGNFYSNDCHSEHKKWSNFAAAFADSDMDMNLVFRWDWQEGEDNDAGEFTGDVNYRNGRLLIFFIGQRKGVYFSHEVEVCRADEHAVIEFLTPRLAHLMKLWAPLEPTTPGSAER